MFDINEYRNGSVWTNTQKDSWVKINNHWHYRGKIDECNEKCCSGIDYNLCNDRCVKPT